MQPPVALGVRELLRPSAVMCVPSSNHECVWSRREFTRERMLTTMRLTSIVFAAVACLAVIGLPSCDGGGVADARGDSSDATDSADAPPWSSCSQVPPLGESCSSPDLSCEYGSDPNPLCNKVFVCLSFGGQTKWVQNLPGPVGICPSTDPGLPSACPAAAVDAQGPCTGTTACHYPDNKYCVCSNTAADGGSHWVCDTGGADCPEPRPLFGTPCPTEGVRCNYLRCLVPWGSAQICTNGTWRDDPASGCAQ